MAALIFVREMSGPLTGLVKKLNQQAQATDGKHSGRLGIYVIFLDNSDGLDKRLRELAEKESINHVSLCIGTPPNDYEISKDADFTAVIYQVGPRRQEKVTANFALRKGELNEAKTDAIVKALAEAMPR